MKNNFMQKKVNFQSGFFEAENYNLEFSFYSSEKPKGIIFFFPEAYDREKGLVQFQRYSWAPDYTENYHCIFLSDPTINEENSISIGWFQGRCNKDLHKDLYSFILSTCAELNFNEKDIIFFGSSAGGFVSLKLSEIFHKANVVVINPQIYLHKFYLTHYSKILDYSFHNASEVELENIIKNRFSFVPQRKYKIEGKVCIFQNTADLFHLKNHLQPMLNDLDESIPKFFHELDEIEIFENIPKPFFGLNVYYYNDPQKGHNPPVRDDTKAIIKNLCM